jgi:DNA-binding transcriptional LysR family regulator
LFFFDFPVSGQLGMTLKAIGVLGMQPVRDMGVPETERPSTPKTNALPRALSDWDGVRVFLQVVRHGSFRAAAEHLGQSVNALRRHVQELERQLGVPLITRHVDGVRVTPEGEEVFAAAQRMEMASFGLVRARDRIDPAISGEVRLAVTEGLGTFWISPRLIDLQRSYPKLVIDMSCATQSADVLRMEADASVQLTRPTSPDLKVVKLGRMHAMPFAAKSYVERYGVPKTMEELLHHRICLQVTEYLPITKDYDRYFPGVPQPGFVAMRTNVGSAHYLAIAKGAGIGLLPTYVFAIGGDIVPVDIGMVFPTDIWLAYHPDAARIPRVRRMLDWIIDSFNPRKFPWFGDDFIHPKDLPRTLEGEAVANLFAGFRSNRSADDDYYPMME